MAREDVDERSTTVVLGKLNNATRVFLNSVTEEMNSITSSSEELSFDELRPLADGKRTHKMWQETGDVDDAMWSCGQSIGLITDVPTCKDLCSRIVAEAEEYLTVGATRVVPRSRL